MDASLPKAGLRHLYKRRINIFITIKKEMILFDGNVYRREQLESSIRGRTVRLNADVTVTPGTYEVEEIESPWTKMGNWLVIKGTKTGLPKARWQDANHAKINE